MDITFKVERHSPYMVRLCVRTQGYTMNYHLPDDRYEIRHVVPIDQAMDLADQLMTATKPTHVLKPMVPIQSLGPLVIPKVGPAEGAIVSMANKINELVAAVNALRTDTP